MMSLLLVSRYVTVTSSGIPVPLACFNLEKRKIPTLTNLIGPALVIDKVLFSSLARFQPNCITLLIPSNKEGLLQTIIDTVEDIFGRGVFGKRATPSVIMNMWMGSIFFKKKKKKTSVGKIF